MIKVHANSRLLHASVAAVLFGLGFSATSAPNLQPVESLRDAVRQFAQGLPAAGVVAKVEVGRLDARLQLHACTQPLDAFLPPGMLRSGRIIVGVRCADAHAWSLLVPVTISTRASVVVLKRPLPRGAPIHSDDLAVQSVEVNALVADFYTDPTQVIGMTTKRALTVGSVITASQVDFAVVVHQGDQVVIFTETGGVQIRVAGKALQNAGVGQPVRVRNLGSERIVEGRVAAPGLVRVDM